MKKSCISERLLLAFVCTLSVPLSDGFATSTAPTTSLLAKKSHVSTPSGTISNMNIAELYLQRRNGSSSTKLAAIPVGSALRSLQTTLHTDPTFTLTTIILVSSFGIQLERKTQFGRALSAPLATMAVGLILANIGVLPFSSPAIYTTLINQYVVSLAVPMLLFDSDLRRVIRDTGSVLQAFFVGALATIVGTLVACCTVKLPTLKVASALCARHIGGAINFVAVAETLQIPGALVSAAIAADNVVVALYFGVLFALAKPGASNDDEKLVSETNKEAENALLSVDTGASEVEYSDEAITLPTIAATLSLSCCLVTLGRFATGLLLPAGTSSLPLTSALTVATATIFPKPLRKLRATGTALGIFGIQMFFAASGASGSLRLVLQQAPLLFLFSTVQLAVHFGVLLLVGRRLFKLPRNELLLASNANVGGPTTAAAMAQAKGWHHLVVPALLVGILGYSSATALALLLHPLLGRLPMLL